MIEFLVSSAEFEKDEMTKTVWGWVKQNFIDDSGICYYRHPVAVTPLGTVPDLTLLTRANHPLAIMSLPFSLDEIHSATEDVWTVNESSFDSPQLLLSDFTASLKAKFDRSRVLRDRLQPRGVLALPLVSKSSFAEKFGRLSDSVCVLWRGGETSGLRFPLDSPLNDEQWRSTKAVAQGIVPLKTSSSQVVTKATNLNDAIKILDRQIALLDEDQEKVAIQIAPGPQWIRGLAGTGKTVLLAMRAANIHARHPDKRILFTFNTQSLYNQTQALISKFYRYQSEDMPPNWDMLHIRHAWGGRTRPGVYSDLCDRQGIKPLTFKDVKDAPDPLQACCRQALSQPIEPFYDFILLDEAQDFPKEFFQMLYKLSAEPHRIYFAYDEMQSLFSSEIPPLETWFGVDNESRALVSFDGEDYPGPIEKVITLRKSYRCPQSVLMVAHGVGLGLYRPEGPVQNMEKEDSWKAIGYELKEGQLQKDSKVVLYRPPENSPNNITDIYQQQPPVVAMVFDDRQAELQWVASSILKDITQEHVSPTDIVVISLDKSKMKLLLPEIQKLLLSDKVGSTIPGLLDDSSAFAEPGMVTLSTVARAKGNEASIVYIVGFEALYGYVDEIGSRNRAFTAISRSKAWVRISGVGKRMEEAKKEVDQILADLPYFKFTFTDMEQKRPLYAETRLRRNVVKQAESHISGLTKIDPRALEEIAEANPDLFDQFLKLIGEVRHENK